MYAEATKVCNGPLCLGKEHPLSNFFRRSDGCNALRSWCKACQTHQQREYRQTPKGRASGLRACKKWKKRNPASVLVNQCGARAKKKGMECSITLEWVEQKLLAGFCEVTGIAFVMEGDRHPFLPSIDRIDSNKGYTPNNCRVVLWIINAAKQALPEEDFQSALRQVAEAVVERC